MRKRENEKKKINKSELPSATRINGGDKSTSSRLSFVEIGVEASFLFLSRDTVCVMFLCSSAVSTLLSDSQETPEQRADISGEGSSAPALQSRTCLSSCITASTTIGLVT